MTGGLLITGMALLAALDGGAAPQVPGRCQTITFTGDPALLSQLEQGSSGLRKVAMGDADLRLDARVVLGARENHGYFVGQLGFPAKLTIASTGEVVEVGVTERAVSGESVTTRDAALRQAQSALTKRRLEDAAKQIGAAMNARAGALAFGVRVATVPTGASIHLGASLSTSPNGRPVVGAGRDGGLTDTVFRCRPEGGPVTGVVTLPGCNPRQFAFAADAAADQAPLYLEPFEVKTVPPAPTFRETVLEWLKKNVAEWLTIPTLLGLVALSWAWLRRAVVLAEAKVVGSADTRRVLVTLSLREGAKAKAVDVSITIAAGNDAGGKDARQVYSELKAELSPGEPYLISLGPAELGVAGSDATLAAPATLVIEVSGRAGLPRRAFSKRLRTPVTTA